MFASEGGELHGHLTLTMTTTEYLAITGAANAFTTSLPPTTLTQAGATGPQISEAVRLHKELLDQFQLYHNINKALRNQRMTATPAVFLQAIKDPTLGFGQ
jgi:7-keto-8-aminopelargonate synthetase-like enzyme